MLFKRNVLEGIAEGRITLAFRRWKRPTVKAGGTLLTPIGVLAIEEVVGANPESITDREAVHAGYDSAGSLRAELALRQEGTVYRIRFKRAGDDPRVALRASDALSEEVLAAVLARLNALDGHSPWTARALNLIARNPGRRAAELAAAFGEGTTTFKQKIRRLNALGLTESLPVGYALSPRGCVVHRHFAESCRANQGD